MAKSPTLRRMFELDASMAQQDSGPWKLLREKLREEVKGIRWPKAMPDLMLEVAELFDIPVSDVFIASWKKSDQLNAAIETSRNYPDGVSFFSLSDHTVTSEFHPAIDVRVPGKAITSLAFTTHLSLNLESFTLRIQNGRITHINAGRYGGKGSIHYGELCLVEKEFKQYQLPLAISLE